MSGSLTVMTPLGITASSVLNKSKIQPNIINRQGRGVNQVLSA